MARHGWYIDNEHRAFPFLKGTVGRRDTPASVAVEGLPDETVVDAGFAIGLRAGFEDGVHRVWLASVARDGAQLTFSFESDAPGLAGRPLQFARNLAAADEFQVEHSEVRDDPAGLSLSGSLSEPEGDCPNEPLWSGYLATGRLAAIAAALGDGDSIVAATATGGTVEPALVQNLARTYVASINVANADRTRVDAPDSCPPIEWAYPVGEDVVHVNATCVRGRVRLEAGFSAVVRQDDADNAIVLSAAVGAGAGAACDDAIPLFAGESPPAAGGGGSTLLEGGPRCNEVLRSINGLGGQFASILNGPGVTVTELVDDATIVIDFNMRQLAVCYSGGSVASEISEPLP